jgi:hypothetical protein
MPIPEEGIGPVNYARPEMNPFAALDNTIRYNDMIKNQIISQYQQNTVNPASMSMQQQRMVATDPKYQYGVEGGQDSRTYQRNAELAKMSYSSMAANATLGMATYGIASPFGAMASTFLKTTALRYVPFAPTILGGMALPMAAAAALAYIPGRAINQAVERQRFIHSTASDIEQYRGGLGFNSPLGIGSATNLAESLQRTMSQGGFFNTEQQSRIHKIGLSNNMISSRGGKAGGTIQQYEKNFIELRDTTAEVVKLLKTTIEGGMSVMKELQQSGFSVGTIKGQIRQAKAFGNLTGLGTQNMLQIGAAGAASVQGTPWSSTVGASMYQSGAAQAATIANANRSGAYAVQRVGGTAAAGAMIATAQMNVLSSGLGTRGVAYAMNTNGTIDNTRMARLLSGKASAYEIESGASQRGYGMGISGRALFERNKEDFLNNLSDMGRVQMTQQLFQKWGTQRYGTEEAKAWVFAGKYTNDIREQRLLSESLLRPKGFDRIMAENEAVAAGLQSRTRGATFAAVFSKAFEPLTSGVKAFGERTLYESQRVTAGIGSVFALPGQAFNYARNLTPFAKVPYVDLENITRNKYGLNVNLQAGMAERLSALTSEDILQIPTIPRMKNLKARTGMDIEKMLTSGFVKTKENIYGRQSSQFGGAGGALPVIGQKDVFTSKGSTPEEIQIVSEAIENQLHGDGTNWTKNREVRRITGVRELSDSEAIKAGETALYKLGASQQSASYKFNQAQSALSTTLKNATGLTLKAVSNYERQLRSAYREGRPLDQEIITTGLTTDLQTKILTKFKTELVDVKTRGLPTIQGKVFDVERIKKDATKLIYSEGLGFKMEFVTSQSQFGGGSMQETKETTKSKKRMESIVGNLDTPQKQEEGLKKLLAITDIAEQKLDDGVAFRNLAKRLGVTTTELERKRDQWQKTVSNVIDAKDVKLAYAEVQVPGAFRMQEHIRKMQPEVSRASINTAGAFVRGTLSFAELKKSPDALEALYASSFMGRETFMAAGAAGTLPMALVTGDTEVAKKVTRDMERRRYVEETLKWTKAVETKGKSLNLEKGATKMTTEELLMNKAMAISQQEEFQSNPSYSESSRDKTNYANVQPPILNYWNNKWVL